VLPSAIRTAVGERVAFVITGANVTLADLGRLPPARSLTVLARG
jgi:hypothetical protein